jgi:hypothetical protein
MNIAYTEVPLRITAKTCGHEDKKKVAYTFIDEYHNTSLDKKDITIAELEACKRLLKYPSASLHKADEDTIKK